MPAPSSYAAVTGQDKTRRFMSATLTLPASAGFRRAELADAQIGVDRHLVGLLPYR